MQAGELVTEWLRVGAVTTLRLTPGERRWIAPGSRWRIARLAAATRFELATHADETRAPDAAQSARVAWLDDVPDARLDARGDPPALLAALAPGEARLMRTDAAAFARLSRALRAGGHACTWHPLEAGPEGCTAVIVRPLQPVNLADYMGRDHAIIEAALAGALAGDAEHARWLRQVLARHLAIEERVLFPAYLAAGGNASWIEGLLREHADLRAHLPRLAKPASRRRFVLMLDGHDEKEEQLIYPDIAAHTGARMDELVARVTTFPLAV